MHGIKSLKTRNEFSDVYRKGITGRDKLLIIRALENNLPSSRFGFSINKKLGKAVIRNRIKRLLKETSRSLNIKGGFDIIYIARMDSAGANFRQIKRSAFNVLYRMSLLQD